MSQRYSPAFNIAVERPVPRTEPLIPKFVLDQEERNQERQALFNKYSSMYPSSSSLTSERRPSAVERVAATNLQRAFRGRLGRKAYDKEQEEEARLRLREAFKAVDNRSSAGDTELSNLTTPAFSRALSEVGEVGEVGKIRKQRRDKGQKRGEYQYNPDVPVGRPRKPRNPVGRPKKIREEDLQGAKGAGIRKRIYKRKPHSNDEKLKSRLRLVSSQILAGNTNQRLIGKVNTLYKKLYNVDNAYQYLHKNKK